MLSCGARPARDLPPRPGAVQRIPHHRPRALLALTTSAVLLAWILTRTSFAEILAAIRSASIPLLFAGYAVTFGAAVISVVRWRLLLRAQGAELPGRFLLQSYMVGFFFNNFLPTTIGGDASRAYDCYRRTGGNQGAMSSVLVDRLLGLLALATLALGCLPLATPIAAHLPGLSLWLGLAVLGAAGLVTAIFFGPPSQRLAAAAEWLPGPLRRGLAMGAAAFDLYRGQWRTLLAAFGLSLLLQLSVVLYFILVAAALGLQVPKLAFGLIVPLVLFVVMLPISLNGLGLRENALVVMLGFYGVGTADAVALAWLVYVSTLLFTLIGGIAYATRRWPRSRVGSDAPRPGSGGARSAMAATVASLHGRTRAGSADRAPGRSVPGPSGPPQRGLAVHDHREPLEPAVGRR